MGTKIVILTINSTNSYVSNITVLGYRLWVVDMSLLIINKFEIKMNNNANTITTYVFNLFSTPKSNNLALVFGKINTNNAARIKTIVLHVKVNSGFSNLKSPCLDYLITLFSTNDLKSFIQISI